MKFKYKCENCFYYYKRNNTCQLKKCRLGTEGYVTLFDKLFCTPCRKNESVEQIFKEYE